MTKKPKSPPPFSAHCIIYWPINKVILASKLSKQAREQKDPIVASRLNSAIMHMWWTLEILQLKHTRISGGSDSRKMLQHHRDDVSARLIFSLFCYSFPRHRGWYGFTFWICVTQRLESYTELMSSTAKHSALGSNSCRYQNTLVHFWYPFPSHTNRKH